MERGAWFATVHVGVKSQARLTHTHTHTHTPHMGMLGKYYYTPSERRQWMTKGLIVELRRNSESFIKVKLIVLAYRTVVVFVRKIKMNSKFYVLYFLFRVTIKMMISLGVLKKRKAGLFERGYN